MKSTPANGRPAMPLHPMLADRYAKPRVRHELVSADGQTINYSVTAYMMANGYGEQHPGSRVVSRYELREVCAYERVLIDSGIGREHWSKLTTDMQRFLNSSPDAGRPSDAMRSAIYSFNCARNAL